MGRTDLPLFPDFKWDDYFWVTSAKLAKDELSGPRGAGYRRMIDLCPVGRAGTPDKVANVGALLMGPGGAFMTGSDFLMDGGVTAAYWYGVWRDFPEMRVDVNTLYASVISENPGTLTSSWKPTL
jgi:hypothetical protein